MNKTFLALVSLMAPLFAFSGLNISPTTAAFGEEIAITGDFANAGDTASILIYFDVNGNENYNEGVDFVMYSSKQDNSYFIDGADDMDQVRDGKMDLIMPAGSDGSFGTVGKQYWIIEDRGGADTASITITGGDPTNTYIAGTVTGPDGPLSFILVAAAICPLEGGGNWDECFVVKGTTDENGKYIIYFADSVRGSDVQIHVQDEYGVGSRLGLIGPVGMTATLVDSLETMDFEFLGASHFLKVVVVDQNDQPLAGVRVEYGNDQDINGSKRTDINGMAIVPVQTGSYKLRVDSESSKEYLSPELNVAVDGGVDTLDISIKMIECDSYISGTITNNAGIDLQRDLQIRVSVEDNGKTLFAFATINSDGSFQSPVSSAYSSYSLHVWGKFAFGVTASPDYFQNVAPGTVDIAIAVNEPTQFVRGRVTDQNDNGVANAELIAWDPDRSGNGMNGLTDNDGYFVLPTTTGNWILRLNDNSFLAVDVKFDVAESDDTVTVAMEAYACDGFISGTVYGDMSDLREPVQVMATLAMDSGTSFLTGQVNVSPDGSFSIRVPSGLGNFRVRIYDYPLVSLGFLVAPSEHLGSDFPYGEVAVGTVDLEFWLMAPGTGKLELVLRGLDIQDIVGEIEVRVMDTTNGGVATVRLNPSKGLMLPLPDGVFDVAINFCTSDSCYHFEVTGIVIDGDLTVIAVGPDGYEIAAKTGIVHAMPIFGLAAQGAQLSFGISEKGDVSLALYGLDGRLVKMLARESMSPGMYRLSLKNRGLAAGRYIARLTATGLVSRSGAALVTVGQ